MKLVIDERLKLPDLRSLIEFGARGIRDAGVEVRAVWTSQGPHGWAAGRTYIKLSLPSSPGSKWPNEWWNSYGLVRVAQRFPRFPLDDWRDCVVYLAAHEFRHIWQQRKRMANRLVRVNARVKLRSQGVPAADWESMVPAKEPRRGEHDAELHGLRMLNKYRVATGREAIPEIKQPVPPQFRRT